ncbi:hypothetical protein ETC01_16795 [Geobacillus sp. NFOSA3]|uniref:Uncharacterized protein n=1 Tax=Parageobacillus toebii TaxID=153151 RepID=A0A150M9F5_9BACL|nr:MULTISPECIES: hypothetical protein [Bacillaceae]NNU94768.1 hypothetical protein [Geobacillus sp. NFOSA3]PDM38757.1 hypothetical protein CN643_17685 [Parageobacillus yumthangensis]TXK91685.1 hypothetical protein FVE24_04760 [Parageobacillus sp. SY1]KYD20882.1 hypothetical protein B4110_3899 [Parageobacillus toebii]PUF89317.1 hypothetical protein DCC82_10025 [Geobacillus sp. LYN3]
MALSFEEALNLFRSFAELKEKKVKPDKINFVFEGSRTRRKTVIRELRHTGNGYIYAGYLPECKEKVDKNGMINIKQFNTKTESVC